MLAFLRKRGDLFQVLLGVLVTAAAASDMLGRPARLVQLLAIGAGMFGAGLGVGAMAARRRDRRRLERRESA